MSAWEEQAVAITAETHLVVTSAPVKMVTTCLQMATHALVSKCI